MRARAGVPEPGARTMPRSASPAHSDIRIRAARGWPDEHAETAPHLPLAAAERAELARLAQIVDFRSPGSQIFRQGDDAAFIHLLVEGVVRTYRALHNGERQILAFHWPGDLFGLAEHGKYVSSAETIAASRVYRFPVAKLENFLLKNPAIQDGMRVKAMHDLRNAQRQLIVMGRFDIPRRIAAFLLDCTVHAPYFDPRTQILTLPMTRYDMADYLGTSAETVTRGLGRLEGEGLLSRVTARALRLRPDRLKAFVDLD